MVDPKTPSAALPAWQRQRLIKNIHEFKRHPSLPPYKSYSFDWGQGTRYAVPPTLELVDRNTATKAKAPAAIPSSQQKKERRKGQPDVVDLASPESIPEVVAQKKRKSQASVVDLSTPEPVAEVVAQKKRKSQPAVVDPSTPKTVPEVVPEKIPGMTQSLMDLLTPKPAKKKRRGEPGEAILEFSGHVRVKKRKGESPVVISSSSEEVASSSPEEDIQEMVERELTTQRATQPTTPPAAWPEWNPATEAATAHIHEGDALVNLQPEEEPFIGPRPATRRERIKSPTGQHPPRPKSTEVTSPDPTPEPWPPRRRRPGLPLPSQIPGTSRIPRRTRLFRSLPRPRAQLSEEIHRQAVQQQQQQQPPPQVVAEVSDTDSDDLHAVTKPEKRRRRGLPLKKPKWERMEGIY